MKTKINQYIKHLEAERNIKILLACETGSRAWGFPSPDSDYDIRVIYMHEKDWYLSLAPKRDHFNLMFEDNMLDITGWDLRKSLNLLYRSNAALLERIESPMVYCADKSFREEISKVAADFYAPIAVMYHYLSLTKKMLEDIEKSENIKLKRLFYALRSALVCKWILTHNERPPISIFKLMGGLSLSESIRQRILNLIAIKTTMDEFYMHSKEPEIITFITGIITEAETNASSLSGARNKTQCLNDFFVKWISK